MNGIEKIWLLILYDNLIKIHGRLILILSFVNNSLMISIYSFSTARYSTVLLIYKLISFKIVIMNFIEKLIYELDLRKWLRIELKKIFFESNKFN